MNSLAMPEVSQMKMKSYINNAGSYRRSFICYLLLYRQVLVVINVIKQKFWKTNPATDL